MNEDVVARFLSCCGSEPDTRAPDTPEEDGFRTVAARLGVPCPPELEALETAAREAMLYSGGWEFLGSGGVAERVREGLRSRIDEPCLAPLLGMLPVFASDGNLLLVDARGAVRSAPFDAGLPCAEWEPVASSFADLLARMVEARMPAPASFFHQWTWVDELEYGVSIGHFHPPDAQGRPACRTVVTGDLAPHYFRYPDGPNAPPLTGHVTRARAPFSLVFSGDPRTVPRVLPVGVVEVLEDGRITTLDLRDELERLVRAALARGWTGRDTNALEVDGWQALGLVPAR